MSLSTFQFALLVSKLRAPVSWHTDTFGLDVERLPETPDKIARATLLTSRGLTMELVEHRQAPPETHVPDLGVLAAAGDPLDGHGSPHRHVSGLLARLVVAFSTAVAYAAEQTAPIAVKTEPASVYIETRGGIQMLNFDFVLHASGATAWNLTSIEVSVFDEAGELELRKAVTSDGVSPGILTIPNREISASRDSRVFNPFVSFDPAVRLAHLRYQFTFESGDQRAAVANAEVRPIAYRSPSGGLLLPLRGRVIVWDGHDYLAHHRRWDPTDERLRPFGVTTNAGRYSYDLVPVNARGDMFEGPRDRNESWFGFGQPVFAAAPGTVVRVHDQKADNGRIDFEALKKDLWEDFGNYVLIDQGNGEFGVYGHIRQASAKVKRGDHVIAGQQLAAVGASGSSLMPHLHFQVQNSAEYNGEGLPSYFRQFRRVLGSRSIDLDDGQIDSGDIVESTLR